MTVGDPHLYTGKLPPGPAEAGAGPNKLSWVFGGIGNKHKQYKKEREAADFTNVFTNITVIESAPFAWLFPQVSYIYVYV